MKNNQILSLLLAVGVIFAAAVSVWCQMPPTPLPSDHPSAEIVPFNRTITENGKVTTRISAKKALVYQERATYLMQAIDHLLFYSGTSEINGKADSGAWQTDTGSILVTGHVVLHVTSPEGEDKNFDLKSESLNLTPNVGQAVLPQPFVVTSKRYRGEGGRANALNKGETILVNDGVRLTFFELPQSPGMQMSHEPVTLAGPSMVYKKNEGKAFFPGRPIVTQGLAFVMADLMIMGFPENGAHTMDATGHVNGRVFEAGTNTPVDFRADGLFANAEQGMVAFEGNVVLSYHGSTLKGEQVSVVLDRQTQHVQDLVAHTNVQVFKGDDLLKGSTLTYNLPEDRVIVTGQPSLTRNGSTVYATQIVSDSEGKDAKLLGDIQGEYKQPAEAHPSKAVEGPMGGTMSFDKNVPMSYQADSVVNSPTELFLDGHARVWQKGSTLTAPKIMVDYVTGKDGKQVVNALTAWRGARITQGGMSAAGDILWYKAQEGEALMTGNCRMWQEQNSLTAENLLLYPKERYLVADRHVVVHLLSKNKPKDEDLNASEAGDANDFSKGLMLITADHMEFDRNNHWVEFTGGVRADKGGKSTIAANSLRLYFSGPGSNQVKALIADGRVDVSFTGQRATGSSFIFEREEGRGVIVGKPCEVWENQRGSVGRLATFWLEAKRWCVDGRWDRLAQSLYLRKGRYQDEAKHLQFRKPENPTPAWPPPTPDR